MKHIVLLLVFVLFSLTGCTLTKQMEKRRERVARTWAIYAGGELKMCAHPDGRQMRSTCAIEGDKCNFILKCSNSNCEEESRLCEKPESSD